MDLIDTEGLPAHPWFAGLGPEPLGDDFNAAQLAAAVAGRRQSIRVTLLDQRIVAGLGNIYVSEALHRARISRPLTAPGGRGRRQRGLKALVEKRCARGAGRGDRGRRGSTLRDYAGADGALGYFQHRFRVYDHADEPCGRARCAGAVIESASSRAKPLDLLLRDVPALEPNAWSVFGRSEWPSTYFRDWSFLPA